LRETPDRHRAATLHDEHSIAVQRLIMMMIDDDDEMMTTMMMNTITRD
jgi:hypothetical protein